MLDLPQRLQISGPRVSVTAPKRATALPWSVGCRCLLGVGVGQQCCPRVIAVAWIERRFGKRLGSSVTEVRPLRSFRRQASSQHMRVHFPWGRSSQFDSFSVVRLQAAGVPLLHAGGLQASMGIELSAALSAGFDAKYGGLASYCAQTSTAAGAATHAQFLAARKVWISHYRGRAGRLTLRSREDLFSVMREISTQKTEGTRVEKRRRFVLVEHWDPSVHGSALDESKVCEIEHQGRMVKGVFLEPAGPEKGELTVVEYGDVSMQDRSMEHENGGPFDEEAAQHRICALRAGMEEGRKHRAVHAVQAPAAVDASTVLALLQQHSLVPTTVAVSEPAPVPQGPHSPESSSDDEVGGAFRAAARLRGFGAAGSSASASGSRPPASSSAGVAHGGTGPAPGSRARGASAPAPARPAGPGLRLPPVAPQVPPRGAAAVPAAGVPPAGQLAPAPRPPPLQIVEQSAGTAASGLLLARKRKSSGVGAKVHLPGGPASSAVAGLGEASPLAVDGRTARIAHSVREALAEVSSAMEAVVFAERPAEDLRLSKEALAQVQSRACTRSKTLAGCEAKLRALLGRIGRSSNPDELQAERDSVQTLLQRGQSLSRFNSLSRMPSPPQSDWEEAVAALRQLNIPLGLYYELLGLRVGINRSIMFGEPDVCVSAFKEGSPEACFRARSNPAGGATVAGDSWQQRVVCVGSVPPPRGSEVFGGC